VKFDTVELVVCVSEHQKIALEVNLGRFKYLIKDESDIFSSIPLSEVARVVQRELILIKQRTGEYKLNYKKDLPQFANSTALAVLQPYSGPHRVFEEHTELANDLCHPAGAIKVEDAGALCSGHTPATAVGTLTPISLLQQAPSQHSSQNQAVRVKMAFDHEENLKVVSSNLSTVSLDLISVESQGD